MKKIERFVQWICSKFTRDEIEQIIQGLLDVLANRNPNVKPKDDFKQKHPNYRNFFIDPNPPLTTLPQQLPRLNWKELLDKYQKEKGKPLQPVNPRNSDTKVPKDSTCKVCSAPAEYLYFNDGKKRRKLKCKLCSSVFPLHPRNKSKYFCPYCNHSLELWKQRKDVSIYKCRYDKCPHFLSNKAKLKSAEKLLAVLYPSHFKLRYQFREYHFTKDQLKLKHSAPKQTPFNIFNIRNSLHTICVVLTFHISLGISARKTAFILRNVFSVPISYQTVLNYTQIAAQLCHKFNLTYKGDVDDVQAGDEAFIKILGKKNFVFFFISSKSRKITAYHIDTHRDVLPAIIAMNEAIRTAKDDQQLTFITDGLPSYAAAVHFLNQLYCSSLTHKKVIGLQNLDSESEEFRPFKQIIERLIRTYRFHTRAAHGFNCKDGAIALTVLFVTHYNFLRPHSSLNYSVPVPLDFLNNIPTLQGKWANVLHKAIDLNLAA